MLEKRIRQTIALGLKDTVWRGFFVFFFIWLLICGLGVEAVNPYTLIPPAPLPLHSYTLNLSQNPETFDALHKNFLSESSDPGVASAGSETMPLVGFRAQGLGFGVLGFRGLRFT